MGGLGGERGGGDLIAVIKNALTENYFNTIHTECVGVKDKFSLY